MAYMVGKKGASSLFKTSFKATAGQTSASFTQTLNPSLLKVYRNGVLLYSTDYTVAGSSVTFTQPLDANDEITIENVGTTVALADYGSIVVDTFTGDGVKTQFDLSFNPGSTTSLDVAISGVTQTPDVDYSWDGNGKVVFVTAPVSGASILVRYVKALPLGVVEPSNVQTNGTSLASPDGAYIVGYLSTTVQDKLSEVETEIDAGSPKYKYLSVKKGNWTQQGGRVYFFNPDAVDVQSTLKNSITVLGGRGDTGYRVTVGPNAELAFHGGGGDTLLDHLAGTICGGAHHVMTKNQEAMPMGSHGFIGGGSYQKVYGDYAGIGWGTLNENYAIKATIVGGDSNVIGTITDQQSGRNAFIGGGYQNGGANIGQYSVICGGRLNTANGQYSAVLGGYENKANGTYSRAFGHKAVANDFGESANSSGSFAVTGDTGHSVTHLFRTTTTSVATQLLPDGNATALVAPGSNTTLAIEARIIGMRTDATSGIADYTLRATLTNETGTLVIKSQSLTVNHEDAAGYNADIIVSGSAYQIRVQGATGHTIRWAAELRKVWVRNI